MPVRNTHLLSAFRASAAIDFITIGAIDPCHTLSRIHQQPSLESLAKKIKVPRGMEVFTVHDPNAADLQLLIDRLPEQPVEKIEIAVDLFLLDGSNNPQMLKDAYLFIRQNLYPAKHPGFAGAINRKRYHPQGQIRKNPLGDKDGTGAINRKRYHPQGQIRKSPLGDKDGTCTMYWVNERQHIQVRLYIKTLDNNMPVAQHCVRLEVTLPRAACQDHAVWRLYMLPNFGQNMRKLLSPLFSFAKGIKPDVTRCRAKSPQTQLASQAAARTAAMREKRCFERSGAMSAVQRKKKVEADVYANRLYGKALKGLREKLLKLRLPENVADLAAWQQRDSLMYQVAGARPSEPSHIDVDGRRTHPGTQSKTPQQ